jgi:hypothetical protein
MEDKVLDWCSGHFPLITSSLFFLIAVVVLTWRVSKRYNFWALKIKENEIHVGKIDAQILPQLSEINKSINALMVYLKSKDITFDPYLFISKSPIRLTDAGKRVLAEIKGQEYVDKHKDALIQRMNAIGIKTALDSQQQAPIVIAEQFNDDSFSEIKNYIFNNPFIKYTREDGTLGSVALNLSTVASVMGIYLRDVYLATRADLNVEDI